MLLVLYFTEGKFCQLHKLAFFSFSFLFSEKLEAPFSSRSPRNIRAAKSRRPPSSDQKKCQQGWLKTTKDGVVGRARMINRQTCWLSRGLIAQLMWESVVTLKYVIAVLNLLHAAYKSENSWVKLYSSRVAFEINPAKLQIPVVRSHSHFYGSALHLVQYLLLQKPPVVLNE